MRSTNPETRSQGIALAAATRDGRYRGTLEGFAQDAKAARRGAGGRRRGDRLVPASRPTGSSSSWSSSVRGKPSSNPVAEAAVRAMARHSGARGRLTDLLTARDYPLGLRREALRGLAELQGRRLLT